MRKEVKELYASYGVDVFEALRKLKETKISLHCWQLDDVKGFEGDGDLTGGIQTTGNYLGRARNFEELTADLDKALSYIPGSKKINLHAIYQTGKIVDRSEVGPEQFKEWVSYAKSRGLGLDYNPTIFSHPMLVDGLSLSSPDEKVRNYWIKHCVNGLKITEMFGKELGQKSLMNIWIPDGLKDTPADRIGPRMRLKESLDKILAGYKYDKKVMDVSVESKVFGIGVESHPFHVLWLRAVILKQVVESQTVPAQVAEVTDIVADHLSVEPCYLISDDILTPCDLLLDTFEHHLSVGLYLVGCKHLRFLLLQFLYDVTEEPQMCILVAVDVTDLLCRPRHLAITAEVIEEHEPTIEVDAFQDEVGDQGFHQRHLVLMVMELVIAVADERISSE